MILCSVAIGILCGICVSAYPQDCGPSPIQKSYNFKLYQGVLMTVRGKTYEIAKSDLWFSDLVGVVAQQDGVVIVDCLVTHNLQAAVTNYSKDVVSTKPIPILAMRVGTYNFGGIPLELWDCGTRYVPPPPTAEQIKAAQGATKIRAIADKKRAMEGQTNAVHWLQSMATNGDVSAQCSLGEHYLNGQGCETNRDLAIQWLKKAADGGSVEASNRLSKLKSP